MKAEKARVKSVKLRVLGNMVRDLDFVETGFGVLCVKRAFER